MNHFPDEGGNEKMKKILVLALLLGAFVATNVHATPQPLDIYGGWDPASTPTWWYLTDYYGYTLENCDCVKVFWKGPNGIPESPDPLNPPHAGGDDVQIGEGHIEYGGFFMTVTTWQVGSGNPANCDEIFVVIFDGSCTELGESNYYGVSQQHHVESYLGETMYAHFPGESAGEHIGVAVDLMSFDAIARDGEVLLEWKTATETKSAGFHIERDGQRITQEIIPGAGDSETENVYTFVDKDVVNGTTYQYDLVALDLDGVEEVVNEAPVSATPMALVPTVFALHQNYPNPFNPATEIKYDLPKDVHVTLKVYNVLGAEVATLVDADQEANFYTVSWDASELASGVYFCTLNAGDFKSVKKMVFLK
jgi:hypothetical protein